MINLLLPEFLIYGERERERDQLLLRKVSAYVVRSHKHFTHTIPQLKETRILKETDRMRESKRQKQNRTRRIVGWQHEKNKKGKCRGTKMKG
jgi:hypothetical protein